MAFAAHGLVTSLVAPAVDCRQAVRAYSRNLGLRAWGGGLRVYGSFQDIYIYIYIYIYIHIYVSERWSRSTL